MNFKTARISAGKTVKEVMDFMNVSDAAVYQWESGLYVPRSEKLLKLAEFYGTTIENLLHDNKQEVSEE